MAWAKAFASVPSHFDSRDWPGPRRRQSIKAKSPYWDAIDSVAVGGDESVFGRLWSGILERQGEFGWLAESFDALTFDLSRLYA